MSDLGTGYRLAKIIKFPKISFCDICGGRIVGDVKSSCSVDGCEAIECEMCRDPYLRMCVLHSAFGEDLSGLFTQSSEDV